MRYGGKLVYVLLLLCALTACSMGLEHPAQPVSMASSAPAAAIPPSITQMPQPTPTSPPDPVDEWLATMSTEEKIGQLLVAGIEGLVPGEDGRAALEDYKVGGIILFQRNVADAAQLTTLTNDLKALNPSTIPLFLSVDQEGGRVSRMPNEVVNLPAPYDYVAGGGDPYDLGKALGMLCSAFGIHLNYAPVLDVWSNPDNTVIGKRAFSSDWGKVAETGTACAQGILSTGVIPVIKHFPGHGDTLADSHKTLPLVEKNLDQLMEEELRPFRTAIEEGVPAVMVAHILMEELDPQYPATLSPAVVDGLLRGKLGFDGMVCTDDLTMGAISNTYTMGEAAVLAVEAGCDLLLVCHKTENLAEAYHGLLTAVESGRISPQRLDESVGRILRVKEMYALNEQAISPPDIEQLNGEVKALLAIS